MKWFIEIKDFQGDFVVLDENYLGWTRNIGRALLFSSRRAAAEYAADQLPNSITRIRQDIGYRFFGRRFMW